MKKKILFLLSSICLTILCFVGMNSNTKTVIANAIDDYKDEYYGNVTSFDHIDIRSAASFTYYVDGKPVTVNINFYEDNTNLSKINIYKKNKNGTLTEIPVSGKWQNVSGKFGNNSSTNKEYRISGNFARYYDNTQKEEVVYVVKFTLSVTIGGVEQELVYTENYSYSSSNNVCPGKINSDNRGIDVEITGTKLGDYFSSSVKIIKNVENANDNTFTFNVKAKNSSIDFNKDVQITTSGKTGFITLGGLKSGEKYIITEKNIPEGYELVNEQPIEITAEKNKTITVTFTNRAKTVDVEGTKTWNDNNNQDGKRPTSITVNLLKNGTKIDSKAVTENDNWTYSFNDLPEYENGKKITYTIEEETVANYTTTITGYNITNTHKPETTSVSGTKTWTDNNDQDGIRPEYITVNLLKNGEKLSSKAVTEKDNWKYSFTNLAKYENGTLITYTIEEETVAGYIPTITGYDITNTHKPETTSISGTKIWSDNNNQDGIRPASITVNLLKNGTKIDSIKVTAEDNWKYSFDNLAKYEAGQPITYTITEESVEGYTTEVNGNDITNTHKPETTSVSGTKTWSDNNNQDGIRPASITVNLLKNGTKIDSLEVTAEDNWKYSFDNLAKYEAGQPITYTITEESVAGYTTVVNGNDITNTHKPETTSVSGTKTWSDNNNQDGIRPTSITVNLLKNGTKIDSVEVTSEDNWAYSFNELPKYENGSIIEYTIKEESVEGYTTVVNGYNLTNIHETEKTTVSGTKTWSDNNNQDGIRPTSITVNLLKNGIKIDSKVVTAKDNWSYTFSNLEKNENGEEISYTITEESVVGYISTIDGHDIINTHKPETTIVMGEKIWNDNNNQDGFRPESITIKLFANNQEISSATITEDANGKWTYAFTNLPKYQNGKIIEYTVREEAVAEYVTTYSEENPYVIINTHQTKTVDINGTKTWDDNNNQDGIRPTSITVRLYADGVEINSKVVTAIDNWAYSFTGLDMYKDGQPISYTITEDAIEGYSTTIDDYNIINTHTPETIDINGAKTWSDNNNQDGKRPEYIIVNLLKNNTVIDTKIVTEETNWTYEFKDLDKYAEGQENIYTLTEQIVEGYETIIDGYNITNTHQIEKITFKATKVWDDNDNQDGIRPTQITVNLNKNGELFQTVTITEEDNWTYEFKDLDRYENGVEVTYTIEEDIVLNYTTEVSYEDIDEKNIVSVTITNTHDPEQTEIEITKTWDDFNNENSLRPNSIDVDLYANGEFLKTIIITDDQEWKYTITDLDKYQNGKEIIYTIEEKIVAGYITSYDGFNIKNTLEFGKGGDVEILPPQTGINNIEEKVSINFLTSLILGLILIIKKFI